MIRSTCAAIGLCAVMAAGQAAAATAATSFNATLLYDVTLTGQNGSRVNNNNYLFVGDQGGGYENISILKYDVSALVAGVGPGETLTLDSAVFRAYHNYIHPNNAAVTTVSLAIGTDDSWLMTDALYSVHATRRGPAVATVDLSAATLNSWVEFDLSGVDASSFSDGLVTFYLFVEGAPLSPTVCQEGDPPTAGCNWNDFAPQFSTRPPKFTGEFSGVDAVADVPAPAALGLLMAGLGALGALGARRRG